MDAPALKPDDTQAPAAPLPVAQGATPVMAQYLEIKAANADSLLFFRMGDFYELFFDDAAVASRVLGIALTKRGKHGGDDIPMAGVPVHAAQDYLQKLIATGHKVAVCEQLEDPAEAKKRGSKAVVKRDVTRLITPGTLTEDALLPTGGANWLLALAPEAGGESFGLAWMDLSTGAFHVGEVSGTRVEAELARLAPAETLFPDTLDPDGEAMDALSRLGGSLSAQPSALFHGSGAAGQVAAAFNVASLDAFGSFSRGEERAAAALIGYVERTQKQAFASLKPPVQARAGGTVAIDEATRASLDLVKARSGEQATTLLAAIDRCVTSAGTRRLAGQIGAPLTDLATIGARHDAVDVFVDDSEARRTVRTALSGGPDLARALSRVQLGRAGPRDLASIGLALDQAGFVEDALPEELPALLRLARKALASRPTLLTDRLGRELVESPPLLARDGGFVAANVDGDLDAARSLRDDARKVIAGLQATYGDQTQARSLKIKHNGVLGYFIEVPTLQAGPLQEAPDIFFHRQTMANAMRFSTKELAELEADIVGAAARALALEKARFDDLCEAVLAERQALDGVADALSAIDVAAGLAETAVHDRHVRPMMRDDLTFDIQGGRHPVVERAMRDGGKAQFVANNCTLGCDGDEAGAVHLITGPNMGGKSTFLRQNALIAILAQAGCFVPAESATIGLVDALFSRVGAADDLARGRSTFMVEMVETAAILHQAGPKSLVILDEIGRGTATYDGLSIAWACVEHLHDKSHCRALFATHYHELTVLAERLERVDNRTLKVREWDGDVIFLHEVVPGAADRSYGLQVAKLAGLPATAVARARQVLDHLETRRDHGEGEKPDAVFEGLPLFAAATPVAERTEPTAEQVEEAAKALLASWMDGQDPDQMTPRQALDFAYDLAARLKEPR
ncbi:MAG: DNA mismatch repair protein MutS [Cohaesibacteraceae bacterium]